MTSASEICMHKCPDKEIRGDVNNCQVYLKADAEEYANDPTYQEYLKSDASEKPFKGKTYKSLSEKKSVGPKGISNQKDRENSAEKV